MVQVDWLGVLLYSCLLHLCMQIPKLHDLEILDHFVQGLKPSLVEKVMVKAPKTLKDAAYHSERTSLAQ